MIFVQKKKKNHRKKGEEKDIHTTCLCCVIKVANNGREQKAIFTASNHMITHNQAYFDKINSNTLNKPKQNQTTPCSGNVQTTGDQPATHNPPANSPATVGHHFRPENSGDFFISGQTQPENTEKQQLSLKNRF
jgi:hypothetical protein